MRNRLHFEAQPFSSREAPIHPFLIACQRHGPIDFQGKMDHCSGRAKTGLPFAAFRNQATRP